MLTFSHFLVANIQQFHKTTKKMLFFSLFEMRDFGGKVKALQVDDTIAATHYLMAKMYKAKKDVINAVAQCTLAITDKRAAPKCNPIYSDIPYNLRR
jgi:hypothetical protein